MLQVFDRVLPSNSQETLLVLLAGTGVALVLLLLLDYVRNRVQNVVGTIVDERLSPPVVHAIVTQTPAHRTARAQGVSATSQPCAVSVQPMASSRCSTRHGPWCTWR